MAKKEKFLESLAKYLDDNNIINKNDIILKYKNIIDLKLKSGEKISSIIKNIGSFEDIIKKEDKKNSKKFINVLNLIINFFKTSFLKIYKKIEKIIINIKNAEEQEINEIKNIKEETKKLKFIKKILLISIKILFLIFIIILAFSLIWISTVFVASIFMLLDGVKLFGANLFIFSILLLLIWLLYLLNKKLTNRKLYFRKNIFIFIFLLMFIGISFGILLIQYYKIDHINDVNVKYNIYTIEKTYKISEKTKKYYLYFNSWYKNKYIINYDESLNNQIKIKINYYECLYDVYLKNKSDSLYISLKKDYRDLISTYIENLKDNKIYDIKELSRNIINIYINKNDYKKLVIID